MSDAPGMNAAVRAVVRTGLDRGFEVFGVRRGYAGLVAGDMAPLTARDVSGIIQQGEHFLDLREARNSGHPKAGNRLCPISKNSGSIH